MQPTPGIQVQQQVVAEQALAVEGAPAKNESRLRDKIAALQEELNQKIESGMQADADALLTSKELLALKEDKDLQDAAKSNLQMELDRCNEINSHLQRELDNSKELVMLAQQQIDQLKDSIRVLQEENEEKVGEAGILCKTARESSLLTLASQCIIDKVERAPH